MLPERQNSVRKSFAKAAPEETQDDNAPEVEAPEEDEEMASLKEDEPTSTGEDTEDQ